MKIYQIHKYTGLYENFRDYIISSYLDYNKALIEKERLVKEKLELQEQAKKCNDCPFIGGWSVEAFPDYCEKSSLKDTKCGIECDNYCYSNWDDATFEIVEVNVIE